MNVEMFAERLEMAAREAGWPAERVDGFTATHFKGRDDAMVSEASSAIGLRLGTYPVIAVQIELEDMLRMRRDLKQLHGQMVIARSYMQTKEVINAHIFLCATRTIGDHDWRAVVDFVERDESVCRKMLWLVPSTAKQDESWAAFIDRTFMARPWDEGGAKLNAELDTSSSLSQRILEESGLPARVAKTWVRLASEETDDPETRVGQMVDALGGG